MPSRFRWPVRFRAALERSETPGRGSRASRLNGESNAGATSRPCAIERLEPRTLLAVTPPGFAQTIFADGVANATAMDFAPDGRLFVAEQQGAIRVIKDGQLLAAPFASVNPDAVGERGLLGIAFDPDFASNKFVYVYWTATTPNTHNRISRFTANGDTAVAGSRVDLFELPALSDAANHNGGAIHFGPDGKLYVGVGENANAANAQSLSTTLGKVLRLNKDGSIPNDNPFANTASGNNRAIWAYGLRNPFTFAFQPGTGKMHINDVGFGTYEEVNLGKAGANYGWPTTEGPTTDARFTSPVTAYKQRGAGGEGSSISGGAFYNPPASASAKLPASYTGDYFFADYGGNFVRVLDATTGTASGFATGMGGPVDLKVGPDGALYVLGRNARKVYRITATGSAASAPTITDQPDAATASPGQATTFAVAAAGDAPLSYQWQRDGQPIAGATAASYTLASPQAADNNAAFRVVVTNAAGSVTSAAATLTVTTNAAPTATINTPAGGTLYRAGDTIAFSATGTDAEDGTLPDSAYDWEVIFHHADHTHPFLTLPDRKSGTFTIPTAGETAADVFYRLSLRVTDSGGRAATATRDVSPRVAAITLATNIPGLGVALDSTPVAAPYTVDGVAGIVRQIGAAPTQVLDGVTYEFVEWSDAGAATHSIDTPEAATTYTATYRPTVGGTPGLSAIDLSAAIVSPLPTAVVSGDKGRATVRITNNSAARANGPATIRLFASTDTTLDDADLPLTSLPKRLKLKPNGGVANAKLKFTYPQSADGSYTLIAKVTGETEDATPADNTTVSETPVIVRPPFVDLAGSLSPTTTPPLVAGEKRKVTVTVKNAGNAIAAGSLTIALAASADEAYEVADAQLTMLTKNVKIKPGASKRFTLSFRVLERLTLPGSYRYVAWIDALSAIAESDEGNNSAAGEATILA